MAADLYRYDFDEKTPAEDIDAALLLAIWGCEALHGEVRTRLDAAHYVDPAERACVIDAGTPVGRDLNRLFAGFLAREIGADAFTVHGVPRPLTHKQSTQETAA